MGRALLGLLLSRKNHLVNVRSCFHCQFNNSSTAAASLPPPPPIEVRLTQNAGRGVFATRPINAGDLIHTAQPLLTHPALSHLGNVCYLCLKRLKLRPWSSLDQTTFVKHGDSESGDTSSCFGESEGCSVSEFCSRECYDFSKDFHGLEKSLDWSEFDEHCRIKGLKFPFLVKRLSCMVISGAAAADSIDILQPAVLSYEMMAQMETEFQMLSKNFQRAGISNENLEFLTRDWYINALARIRINSFRVELIGGTYEDLRSSAAASVSDEPGVGNAIYMLPSFYNHDCDPNANILWLDSANARLKALTAIETGEEIRICYIDASMDYNARQTILYNGFGFQCRCARCTSED